MSFVLESFASRPTNNNNNNNNQEDIIQRSDLLRTPDPTPPTLSLPTDIFLRAAISLKNQVVKNMWEERSGNISEPTVYSGVLGTAFTCLRAYEATGDQQDLLLCGEIVDACATVSLPPSIRHVTFLHGQGGIYSLGAVVSNYKGDHQKRDMYLKLFLELAEDSALPVGPQEGGLGMSYDLLYGRTGFLWAALFINKYLGETAVPSDLLMPIVKAVLAGGRAGASDTACPLMYRWHGTRYWGAANGLAGILHVLLHFPLSEEDAEDVKGTLRYMMSNRFPHSGNYPSCEGNPRDKLVQWSHGAGGMAITLSKASKVFTHDREFQDAAIEAGEVVWKRGLVEKPGLSDGASGNAYAFLSLYQTTGESIYEERAKAFASFLYHKSGELMMVGNSEEPNHTYSLLLGLAGTVCLWFDLLRPEKSRFPGYEI